MNIIVALASLTTLAPQDKPVDIPKVELPKSAVCVVCSSNGETHGEEKPAAGVRYLGKSYFFCNAKEVPTFKSDPSSFMLPVLPRPAPALNVATFDGKKLTMADYKDKVVLIDYWATWCAPCIKVMPELDKLYKKYAAKDLVILGVSIDEDSKKAVDFQAKRKFSYPIVLDNASAPSWSAWKVKAIPAMFLVDRKGQIVAQWKGEPKLSEVESAINKALVK